MAEWHSGNCTITIGEELSLADEIDSFVNKPLLKIQDKIKKKEEKKAVKKAKKKKEGTIDINGTLFSDKDNIEPDIEIPVEQVDIVDYGALVGFEDEEEDTNDEFDMILKEQKKSRLEAKKKDEIKKDFADNLGLLYTLLQDAKEFEKSITKQYNDANKGRRTQGFSKYTSDMAQAVVQSRKATLDIVKEINSVKKTVYDLQAKADSRKANVEGAQANEMLVNGYLNNIMNSYGRGNIVSQIKGAQEIRQSNSSYGHYAEEVANGGEELDDVIEAFRQGPDISETDYDYVMNRIESRLDNEENNFRSEEGNRYIAYEKYEPKILVKRNVDTGDWHFIAVSKDNIELPGYPLPSKQSAGKMTFTADGDMVSDSKGRSYKVINYFNADNQ